MESRPDTSAELRAAQERLLQLRAALGITPQRETAPAAAAPPAAPAARVSRLLAGAQQELQRRRAQDGLTPTASPAAPPPPFPPPAPADVSPAPPPQTLIAHPTLLLAMLQQQQAAAGRVYFLLRHLDHKGQGWVTLDAARAALTDRDSPLRICGWRRLRQLLAQGEGLFWQRGRDRLWLQGQHKIAHSLACERMQGRPVDLPVSALLGGMQAVRAAFYACFHGGRDERPISRETLQQVTGIAARTQRSYDRLANVTRRRHMAIGAPLASTAAEERAWRHGRATFTFIDTDGRQGRQKREYLAWHLPNSYRAAYQRHSKGSRKRLNRKLTGLLNIGTAGNDGNGIEQIFFPNGALAARQHLRAPAHDAYWPQPQPTRSGRALWQVVACQTA